MLLPRSCTAAAIALLAALAPLAPASDPPRRTATSPAPSVLDYVSPNSRDAVAQVMKNATLSAKAADEEFTAHTAIYDWLLEHPDRASLAWRRMKVPCVEIKDLGKGQFHWADPNGSELTWQTVGRFPDGLVWYATGKVNPGTLLPTAPVKAVAILRVPRQPIDEKAGTARFQPLVNVYLQTDSRAATALLRMIGPAAPRMAEDGAEQLLLFFSGPARYIHKHPGESQSLLAPAKK
jgi:hypothetical protein